MKFTFIPEHIVINDLFGRNIRYIIPQYQRPYSWDCIGKSEKNNQINTMWDDLIEFYKNDDEGEYFFGSMVMIEKVSRQYDVVDGQQRLTSLVLLFVAIKCFLIRLFKEKNKYSGSESEKLLLDNLVGSAIVAVDDIIFNKETFGLTSDKKVKIEKSAEYDYDKILSNVMECSENHIIGFEGISKEQEEIIERYYKNRDFFITRIEKKFLTNGFFDKKNWEEINKFTYFIQNRLSVVRIKTPDFNAAFQIFEILNNRGLPLSNKDLFRNFIISEFAEIKSKYPEKFSSLNPGNKWIELEKDFSLTTDFIARWVESKKGGQQKFSAFNDLKEIYEKKYYRTDKEKIEVFYDDIKRDLSYYTVIVEDMVADKRVKHKIQFLKNSGNLSYTINLLLALFKYLKFDNTENKQLLEFLTQYEEFVLYVILAPGRRFSSSSVYNSINYLNSGDYQKAYEEFAIESNQIEDLKKLIDGRIEDNLTAKLLIAKYIWAVSSKSKDDVIDISINYEKATLEHIIPQEPKAGTNWKTDFSDDFRKEFTYKLGNMTLLSQSLNSAARNFDFSKKQEIYNKTLLGINENIIELKENNFDNENKFKIETIDTTFFIARQERIVQTILKDLEIK